MGDNNEETSLTDVVVAQPALADQNELIIQLMQQIAEMRVEMKRKQDLPPPIFAVNAQPDGRPLAQIPIPDMEQAQNQPSSPAPSQNAQSPSIAPPLPQKTTFQIPVPNEHDPYGSELDHYEEREREWRSKEETAKIDAKEEIRKALKELNCIPEVAGLSYEDMCIHPNLDLPKGFKVPKFDIFRGTGNPLAHLGAYCDQLVGVGKDEALLMRLFSRSLSGEALEWFTSHETRQWSSWNALAKDFIERFAYNVEIVPDRYSLEKMKQKSTESFREFAYRWRKEVARVRPRETIEDGLRTGKIARVAASPGSSGLLKKKREDVSSISYEGKKTPRKSLSYQARSRPSQGSYPARFAPDEYQSTPPPSYQNTPPPSYQTPPTIYQTPPPDYQTPSHHYRNAAPNCANIQTNYQTPPPMYQTPTPLYQNTPSNHQAPQPSYQTNSYPRYQAPRPNNPDYCQMPHPQQSNYDPPRPRFEKKPARIFTPLIESQTKLLERLTAAGYIHLVGLKPVDTSSKFYRPDQRCAYHSSSVGHDTEDCINLKPKIQDLIDQNVVSLQTVAPNVNSNPLPNHRGATINMIETDDDWCVTKAIVPIAPDELERAVASLSIREKKEFVILTPEKVVALVPREALTQPKFVIETAVTQGMTRSVRCYTPEELAQGGQKKDQTKRPISEAEEFWRKM
ncbi:uncharacterized protein [Solanum tuberosum]|uniref:uncharacterized protein n=1 Tax=Solanum tuberosum TaxID=4113 RepID=UPI00073A529F|nr:PREDICTED: uncharacterized protein LOC107060251 [Solanum tuberosum]